MRQLVDEVCKRYKGAGLDLVILEPSYKLVTPSVQGTNGEFAVLEYLEALDEISHELKCGVMSSHHSPKGDLSARSSLDLFSGSGVWARDPDVLMTLRPHQKDGCTILQTTRRHGEPKDDVVLRWEYPLHHLALDEDPSQIRSAKQKSSEETQNKVVELLGAAGEEGWCNKKWLAAAESKGISSATYYRAVKWAKLNGKVQVIQTEEGRTRYALPFRPF
jgi:RecA-family ATPase